MPAIAGGQNEHWHIASGFAPFPQYGQTIHDRKTKIQYDCIVGFDVTLEMGISAIAGMIDHIACRMQCMTQLLCQRRIIFHHKNTHQSLPLRSIPRPFTLMTWPVAASILILRIEPAG